MCGRYVLRTPAAELTKVFRLAETPSLAPRFNIAPTQPVPVVRLLTVRQAPGEERRELAIMRWGLIPHWAKDPAIGGRLINARAETVAEKPAFREALRKRRCLILTDGFYEWKKEDGRKQPYYIAMRDQRPFAFAGLWDEWDKEGESIETCTILTTTANELIAPIHERMPVILASAHHDLWLDVKVQDPKLLLPLLSPYLSEEMTTWPVHTLVNNARNESPKCLERMD